MIGENISHYRILEKLGEGGMGVVYKAEDIKLKRNVALKFLPPSFSFNKEAKQRFIYEAQSASALDHSNICNIHEIGETAEGQLFIVMAYYEGETLKDKIGKGSIDTAEAVNIILQIAEGLMKAHEKGIVHRDIKPANILITNEGVVKILDFGLAKSSGRTQLTQIGTTFGTCNYMSPEQATGEEVDQRTDIWALGVVMFEMLTGVPPFNSDYDQAIIYSILNEELNPDELKNQIPKDLTLIILKCLIKDKDKRYQHIDELISELGNIKRGRSITHSETKHKLPSFLISENEEIIIDRSIFVAREPELEKLEKFLEAAISGKGQLAFISGESGAGKTALVQTFSRQAQELITDIIVVNGKCNAHTGFGDPYFPFIELLNLLTGDIESQYKAGVIFRDHALQLWNLLPTTIKAILENGRDLINIFTNGTSLVSRASDFCTAQTYWLTELKKLVEYKSSLPVDLTLQQKNIFEQYTRVIQTIAEEKPMLIVLDDLQWIDAGSANLFFHIARQIKGSRILIIGTFRKTEITIDRDGQRHPFESVFNELKRDYGEIEIDLDKLEGREFINEYLDLELNNLDDRFRNILFNQTKGHPLFTVELFRSMKEQGMIVKDQTGRWTEGKTFDWNRLPSRIDAVITERINRLKENVRNILLIACIEGEEFTAEVVARQLNIDEKEVIRILSSELEKRHHLVIAKGVKTLMRQRLSLYVFQHILFQKYLYASLDEIEKIHLHEEVGKIIEELYGDQADEISVRLAIHFQEARMPAKAMEYLVKAGTRALHLSAYEETIVLFKKALDILKTFPESPERNQHELSIHMALVAASQTIRGFGASEVVSYCNRIEELCKRFGDAPQIFDSLYYLSFFNWLCANHKTAFNFTEQMMRIALKANDTEKAALTHFMQGTLYFHLGNFSSSIEHLKEMNSFYIPEKNSNLKYIYGFDPGLGSGFNTASVLWCLGYPDQALTQSKKTLAAAYQVDHSFSLATSLALDTLFHLLSRNIPELELLGKEVYELSEKKGFPFFMAVGIFKIGFVLLHKGQIQEGINRLHQALELYKATGVKFTLTDLLGSLAEAYGIRGDIDKGMAFMEQAITEVKRGGEQYYEAELYRIKGELLLKGSENKDRKETEKQAEECFMQSIKVAQRQKAKSFELRTSLSLCRQLQKQSKKEKARLLLTNIYEWFTEGFDTPDLKEAKVLLEELKS